MRARAAVWPVAEGQDGPGRAVGQWPAGAELTRPLAHHGRVEVGVGDPDVHPGTGRDGHLTVHSGQSYLGGGAPQQVGHHRFQAQDLVQDGDPGRLVPGDVRLAERVVAEQVPGDERDELPGGDHPGGGERDALAEDLRIRTALVEQVGDQVVAAFPAPGRDRRPYVQDVEAAEGEVLVRQAGDAGRAGPAGYHPGLEEETVQPPGHATPGRGQADHLAGHRDGQREGQFGQVGAAPAAQPGALFLGVPVHQLAVLLVDPPGREELRRLAAVLAVFGAVTEQYRGAHPARPSPVLDAEAGLAGIRTTQERPRAGVVPDVPGPVAAHVYGTAGRDRPTIDLAD